MKMKSLLAVAASGLLVTSFVYAADEMQLADNSVSGAASMNSNVGASTDATPDVNASANANVGATDNNAGASTTTTTTTTNGNASANDDMSADTATGDDDY